MFADCRHRFISAMRLRRKAIAIAPQRQCDCGAEAVRLRREGNAIVPQRQTEATGTTISAKRKGIVRPKRGILDFF